MSRQEVYIDPREFGNVVGKALERGAEGGLLRAGLVVEKNAQDFAPEDKGDLKGSIKSREEGRGTKMVVTVGPNVKSKDGAPYDIFQEFGTGVYKQGSWLSGGTKFIGGSVIRPRKAKALMFRAKGDGWRRFTNISYGGKKGVIRGTTQTSQYHGNLMFAKWVRGVRPTRYMEKGIAKTDIPAEFVRGFNATK